MWPDNESRRFGKRSASAIRHANTKQHKPFRKVTNRTAPNASKQLSAREITVEPDQRFAIVAISRRRG
jgi:hypothetical protein